MNSKCVYRTIPATPGLLNIDRRNFNQFNEHVMDNRIRVGLQSEPVKAGLIILYSPRAGKRKDYKPCLHWGQVHPETASSQVITDK